MTIPVQGCPVYQRQLLSVPLCVLCAAIPAHFIQYRDTEDTGIHRGSTGFDRLNGNWMDLSDEKQITCNVSGPETVFCQEYISWQKMQTTYVLTFASM